MDTEPDRIDKAVVLGGGGLAGVARGCGYLTGLQEGGIDLGGADRVVGTSAGSIVAASMTAGRSLHRRYSFLEDAQRPLRRALTALFEASTSLSPAVTEEVAVLERDGTVVHAAWPGADAVPATGGNALDPKVIPAVARTGRVQGLADAAVSMLWAGRTS